MIHDMQDAIEMIVNSTSFIKVMPEVRANLVACEENAESTSDVAGVPGRILLVDGQARVLGGPQFGSSKHTAHLLLWAKRKFKDVLACLGISGCNEIVEKARDSGIQIISLSTSSSDAQNIVQHANTAMRSRKLKAGPKGLHVPGGFGIEPILYLFGHSATELSRLALAISSQI